MTVTRIDPIQDPRWHTFVESHPAACIFHTAKWLEALKLTYGFEPVAYVTTLPSGQLRDGLVLCHLKSWLTGNRSVSLPFSDHCSPLVHSGAALKELLCFAHEERRRSQQRFVEIRPSVLPASTLDGVSGFGTFKSFCLHTLDLSRTEEEIFKGFVKSERNAVRRAERENLQYESGNSAALLNGFYRLFVSTRRRHGVPPQPFKWFENVVQCLGDQVAIRIASKDGVPIAATMTLSFRDTIVYKYACSDDRYNNLGAMPFLCWQTIREAKSQGATQFDLGRSDLDHHGLITFKNRLGAHRAELFYYRDTTKPKPLQTQDEAGNLKPRTNPIYRKVLPVIPERLFVLVGELLYKHVG